MKDWRVWLGGGALVALVVWLRERPGAPDVPAPPVAPGAPPRGRIIGGASVAIGPARTYFVALETNGDVALAANEARIENEARKLGFTDPAVFKVKPGPWPLVGKADYFFRGTYGGAPRSFPRVIDRTFGSAKLVDVFEA